MRKVKLGSIFRLGRINNKIVHSIRSEGKLLAVLHSVRGFWVCILCGVHWVFV